MDDNQNNNEQHSRKIKQRVDDLHLESKDKKDLKAIAVEYNVEKDRAPKIVASGKGSIAEEILKVAEENEIPLYQDATLANLLSKLQIDEEIPEELYTLVAEVLAFVYQLETMAKKREKIQKFSSDTNSK